MKSTMAELALTFSRWIELSLIGKATLVMTLGLIAAAVTKRSRASIRHLLLATTFAALLLLPLATMVAPALTIEIPVAQVRKPARAATTISQREAPQGSLTPSSPSATGSDGRLSRWFWLKFILWSVWLAGALLPTAPLVLDLWRVRRILRNGLPSTQLDQIAKTVAAECGLQRPIKVLVHENILAPLTCGVLHPVILLPRDAEGWDEHDLHRALIHELEHARRGDWITQLVARIVCAVYWFHPLVWIIWRHLCLEAERACDDAVLQRAEHTEYAEQLVLLSRRLSSIRAQPILGMANRSDLSRRVSALLDADQRRGRAGVWRAAGAMLICAFVVITIGPLRAVAHSPNEAGANPQTFQNNAKRDSTPFDRALFEAAADGNISDINRLLDAGANVNCALPGDGSPLIAAAREGHQAAVKLLLDRGADPNMAVQGDGNPLIMAAREGHVDIVTLLLDRGANIDQIVPGDENALIQSSGNGELDVVKLLAKRGADINARAWVEHGQPSTGEWRTPLGMARKGRHSDVVSYLLSLGARE